MAKVATSAQALYHDVAKRKGSLLPVNVWHGVGCCQGHEGHIDAQADAKLQYWTRYMFEKASRFFSTCRADVMLASG